MNKTPPEKINLLHICLVSDINRYTCVKQSCQIICQGLAQIKDAGILGGIPSGRDQAVQQARGE